MVNFWWSQPYSSRSTHEKKDVHHDGRDDRVLLDQDGKQEAVGHPRLPPTPADPQNGLTLLLRNRVPPPIPVGIDH